MMIKQSKSDKSDKRVAVKKDSWFSKSNRLIKSFYNDPFRWQVTKSVGVFIVGIYLAKDISSVKIFENV